MPTRRPALHRSPRDRRHSSSEQAPRAVTDQPLTRYVSEGHPALGPEGSSMADALRFSRDGPDRMALFFYPAPGQGEITELGAAWELHPVLLEDLLTGHQRPKIERYGDVLFLVVRSARYKDKTEEIDFAEFHILVRPGAVAVLCQDARWIDGTDGPNLDEDHPLTSTEREHSLLADVNLLKLGPEAVAYRVLDTIVDGYVPVLRELMVDKEQIERQVFSGDAAVAERIYRLSQEVIDMQQTISSLADVVDSLHAGFDKYEIPGELRAYLNDVADHLSRAASRAGDLREALSQILNVNATLVAQRQNEDMKKISGWAAILFAPTLVGAVYGMNFDDMPELHWAYGYPMAISMMVALAVLLYVIFKRSNWM